MTALNNRALRASSSPMHLGPSDDPVDAAIEAIEADPAQLHDCACRVIRTGAFDDLLFDQIKDSALASVAKTFVEAVRAEITERASEAVYCAREYNRECREDR